MSEITDLAQKLKEENEKNRAQQERIANGEGPYAKATVDAAKASLKKQDIQRALTKKMLGISERRMAKAEDLSNQIKAQEQIMAEQKLALEQAGVYAEGTSAYQKAQIKLDKLKDKKAKATGASATEDRNKADAKDSKMLKFMKNTAGFLGGIAKQGLQRVKSGLQGFSKFAFGALALAALSFLNSPLFDKYYDQIIDVIIPGLIKIYTEVLLPLGKVIKKSLGSLFSDILLAIDGKKGWVELLEDNYKTIGLIGLALAPGLLFTPLLVGVGLLFSGITKAYTSVAVTKFLGGAGGKIIGGGLLLAGLAMAIKDGVDGYVKAADFGVSKTAGALGFALGGMEKEAAGAFDNAGKFALIGAGLGSIFPVIGTFIGGAVGALIGAALGYFGGEAIAKSLDEMGTFVSKAWNELTIGVIDGILNLFDTVKSAVGISTEATTPLEQEEKSARAKRTVERKKEADKEKVLAEAAFKKSKEEEILEANKRIQFEENAYTKSRERIKRLSLEKESGESMDMGGGSPIVQTSVVANAGDSTTINSSTSVANSNPVITFLGGGYNQGFAI